MHQNYKNNQAQNDKKNTFFIYNPKINKYDICIYEITFLNYKNVFF